MSTSDINKKQRFAISVKVTHEEFSVVNLSPVELVSCEPTHEPSEASLILRICAASLEHA
ncbi:hypothetical protein RRF57_008749 [Xylaria bambusicola]|uniref:Uncharacterized protein n=1 Tax=Xylaria bambusicola TaxID=326684 RepID=A0AAN7ZBE4_9PEZI